MRLWSLHPRYLDRQGLTACWREALLAQAVLTGGTRGYQRHPQLDRFRRTTDPVAAIGAYLEAVRGDAQRRGYRFDSSRVVRSVSVEPVPVTDGQLALERRHLAAKLAHRSPGLLAALPAEVDAHPMFVVRPGDVEPWERATS